MDDIPPYFIPLDGSHSFQSFLLIKLPFTIEKIMMPADGYSLGIIKYLKYTIGKGNPPVGSKFVHFLHVKYYKCKVLPTGGLV